MVKTDVIFNRFSFRFKLRRRPWSIKPTRPILETANPQCFAKAGKMEPNHLLNGFGPLQPAVAMLWWLLELLLSPSAHHCTSRHRRQLLGEWLKCAKTFDTWCSNFCPIKASYTFDNFGAVHFFWVSVASLPPSGLIFRRHYQRLSQK